MLLICKQIIVMYSHFDSVISSKNRNETNEKWTQFCKEKSICWVTFQKKSMAILQVKSANLLKTRQQFFS